MFTEGAQNVKVCASVCQKRQKGVFVLCVPSIGVFLLATIIIKKEGMRLYSIVHTAAVHGIDSCLISVEADISNGMPVFDLTGMLAKEVKESKERVRTAMKNCGFSLPAKRITVNLFPADIKKEGSGYDLPIATAILRGMNQISDYYLKDSIFVGELSLNGTINHVNGMLSIVSEAQKAGFRRCFVPKHDEKEGALIHGIQTIGVRNLLELVTYLNKEKSRSEYSKNQEIFISSSNPIIEHENSYNSEKESDLSGLSREDDQREDIDFSEINGQYIAKRACEIAAAGRHNLLFIGPPGSGKTMMAKRIPTILPALTIEESLEISKIYSVLGLIQPDHPLIARRPFRMPHHSITSQALIGGGTIPKPGEVSLAHHGILFLDELTEFDNRTLEMLRQPLEDKQVIISRMNGSFCYPAGFQLTAAMNPCRCGYYPDRSRCSCSPREVSHYLNRISQPLLDRMDLCVEASEVSYQDIKSEGSGESSKEIRKRVEAAHEIQKERYQTMRYHFNSDLDIKGLKKFCRLTKEGEKLMETAFTQLHLSARGYHRILKVSRTIADLEGKEDIQVNHLKEAVFYRTVDKKFWEG